MSLEIAKKGKKHHTNYYKLKIFITEHALKNCDELPPCREIAKKLKIGKSSIHRQLNILVNEEVLEKKGEGRNLQYIITNLHLYTEDEVTKKELKRVIHVIRENHIKGKLKRISTK